MMRLPGPVRAALATAASVCLLAGGSRADPAHDAFRFSRALLPVPAGPVRINVDVPLLAGAERDGGLRDLRFTDFQGREVPYLLVPPVSPDRETWLSGTVSRTVATATESGFELDLRRVARVDHIRLAGLPRPLLKQARVEGSGDHAHYTLLVARAIVVDLPDEQLEDLDIPLPDGEERYLRVTWDDHATAPLALPRSVSAREVTPTTSPEPLRADVAFERRPSRVGESRFRVHLPAPLPLVGLDLACGGDHLLRAVQVTEPRLEGGEVVPAILGAATLRRSTRDGLTASALHVPVGHADASELDLAVDDGDNGQLDLQRVTVVVRPQPWVYLEVASSTALLAHYGNAKLAAPRYDLEAAREAVEHARPVVAEWARPIAEPTPPSTASPMPPAGAPLDPGGFTVTRAVVEVPGAGPGLAALALDAPVLAHSARLVDLRLRDATGHQVPYLLEHVDEPTVVPLTLAPVAAGASDVPRDVAGTTLYRIDLPFTNLPAGRLVLTTGARTFRRRVTLLAMRPANASPREPEVTTLDARDWSQTDAESAPRTVALPLDWRGATVFIRVDEGDNEPLPLSAARLELPGVRLRFFRESDAKLTLLYGKPDLAAPRYDLALLAPTLAGAAAAEVKLGPEAFVGAPEAARRGMPVFWITLVGAVGVLLILMVVLLRGGAPQNASSPPPSEPPVE